MKPSTALALACLCAACGSAGSSFEFQLGAQTITSASDVSGSIDNAGALALHDDAWALNMVLSSAVPNQWTTLGAGDLSIFGKTTGDIFTTAAGGTCDVLLDPHASTNGSIVTGAFHCTGLRSSDGSQQVDVPNGAFTTRLDDVANNPTSWPWP